MNQKQLIQEKLGDLTEEQLAQVYAVIEQFRETEYPPQKSSFLSQLQQFEIDAPEDFSIQVGQRLGRVTLIILGLKPKAKSLNPLKTG
ncbi:hypothetical protein PN462_21995 [Spirulina sp. CS-785/01]|uniref:hypothetical protein n=1 Tax=Spirulina sp. CS-785/01 TaxID=3021716 RepID=UPI00232D3062|nr:hypothetical protein [Spirulina sp. CS-785/01]MDB9315802.1 hypothetical protein [Spirulina sp. CS-785/01]